MTDTIEQLLADTDTLLERVDKWRYEPDGPYVSFEVVHGTMKASHGLIDTREALTVMASKLGAIKERRALPIRQCQCDGADISLCGIHLVNHPFSKDCCDHEKELHRHSTPEEFDAHYPKVFDATAVADGRRYRVDARKFDDGVSVCITQLFEGDDEDGSGLCFDLSLKALRAILPSLEILCITGDWPKA